MSGAGLFLHAKNKYNLILSAKSDFLTCFLDAKNKYNLMRFRERTAKYAPMDHPD